MEIILIVNANFIRDCTTCVHRTRRCVQRHTPRRFTRKIRYVNFGMYDECGRTMTVTVLIMEINTTTFNLFKSGSLLDPRESDVSRDASRIF